MALRIPVVVSLSLVALGASLAAHAQAPAPFKGDATRGHELTYTCNGCHAVANYKNVYPTYSVPKLHGQRPEYIVAALDADQREDPGADASNGALLHGHRRLAHSLNECYQTRSLRPWTAMDCARWHLRAQVLNIAACFWELKG